MGADYQYLGFDADQQLIQAFWVESPRFGFHWHYHPELEITCVRQGRGTRMVGDNVGAFKSGDFVFLGSNLPHTWISDDEFSESDQNMEVAVLQFHPSVFSGPLLAMPEMENIRRLLGNADRGIRVVGDRQVEAANLLYQMIDAEGMERFGLFLTLLNLIGAAENFETLASMAYTPPLNNTTEERILDVCRHIHAHFMHPVRLETIAGIANMNTTSFCRFFKKSTGMSLSEYVNDLRIGKACNLLLDRRKLSMTEVAHQSGFNSQTQFNRLFQRKKQMTPSQFRQVFKT